MAWILRSTLGCKHPMSVDEFTSTTSSWRSSTMENRSCQIWPMKPHVFFSLDLDVGWYVETYLIKKRMLQRHCRMDNTYASVCFNFEHEKHSEKHLWIWFSNLCLANIHARVKDHPNPKVWSCWPSPAHFVSLFSGRGLGGLAFGGSWDQIQVGLTGLG